MDIAPFGLPANGMLALIGTTLALPRKVLVLGVATAMVVGVMAAPASAPRASSARATPDAYVVEFTGEVVRSGPNYRVKIDGAPTFRVGRGIAVPLGTVGATGWGIVVDFASPAIGAMPMSKAGVGRGTVQGIGGDLYTLSHMEWATSPGGYGVVTGGVKLKGGKFRVSDTFKGIFRLEHVAGAPGDRISRLSGSAAVEVGRWSWLSSRPMTF